MIRFFTVSVLIAFGSSTAWAKLEDPEKVRAFSAGSYLAGNYAFERQNYAKAVDYYTNSLPANSQGAALFKTYWAFVLSGMVERAVPYVQQYYATEPLSSSARLLLSLQAYQKGQVEEGAEYILSVGTQEVQQDLSAIDHVIWPYLQIWANASLGKTDAAERQLQGLIKEGRHPKHFLTLQQAKLYSFIGADERAKSAYDRLYQMTTLPSNFLRALIEFYQHQGDAVRVEKLYERYRALALHRAVDVSMLAMDSSEGALSSQAQMMDAMVEVYKEAARVLMRNELYNEAIVYAYMAHYLAPEDDEAYFYLGTGYSALDIPQKALWAYQNIEDSSGLSYSARVRMMRLWFEAGERKQAIKIYQRLQKRYPGRYQVHVMLGDLYREDERFALAKIYYNKALALIEESEMVRPIHWAIYFGRGIVHERLKEWVHAEQDLQTALTLHPQQPDVLNYLGYGWLERGIHVAKARELIEQAIAKRPQDAYIIDSMAWLLYKEGNAEEAVLYLERAVELEPYDAELNHHLGDIYWSLGRKNEARFQWKRALEHNPKSKDTKALQKKMHYGLVYDHH